MRPVGSKYLLEEPLGRGATGTVWRARIRDGSDSGDSTAGTQHVAIKVLKEELAADPDVVMRFLRERSVLLRLIHPNIVRVRDLVVEGELLALVMDLVEGPDLNRYLREHGPLSPVAGALLMAQIADALAASHADGVVHRDLKPANVMLSTVRTPEGAERMHPLLTDFGIARLADSPGLTRTHEFVGTPAYVAPESAEGREQTAAVDIYGAGIMMYELLTGKPPFHGDGPLQILQAHLSQEPPRPRNLPEPLWHVVERCLSKDPARRPSAVTLATALRTVAAGIGVHASSAQIEAAMAVGALLAPPLVAGNDPTVPNGVRYDPGAPTVFGAVAAGAGYPAGADYPFGAADPTQVLPPGSFERTQRIPPSNGQFGPPPGVTTTQPVLQGEQAQQSRQSQGQQAEQGGPGQQDPHPWENQLRAARTRNEQTRVDYRFPAEPGPQPQVAPPPYRPAPQPPQYQAPAYVEPEPRPQSRPQPAPQPQARPQARPDVQPRPAPRREPERAPEPAPRRGREPRPPRRRRRIPGGGCLRVLLVLAVIAACVWYFTPAQDWIHHVESWWHQVVQWWNDATGTANKIKKDVGSVPSLPPLPTPKG
ncbi:serine/threonine-protein kinase [Streptacidiphilus sp. PAMC 29251]